MRPVLTLLAWAIVLLAVIRAPAQEALRSSLAYDRAIELNQNPSLNLAPDRPHLGPVQLTLGCYTGIDFQDNIILSQTAPLADEILHFGATFGFDWPATLQSDLSLNTSVGYAHYLHYSQYDYLEIGPNSALSWNVFFEDGSLTFFDQFSYSQQALSQAALTGVANFPIFDNTIGLRVNWLPNQWSFKAGYSHNDYLSDSSAFAYLNRSSEYLYARGARRFAEKTEAGLETSASVTSYRVSGQGDSYSASAGPYVEWQVTRAIHATIRGGPTAYFFSSTNGSGQGNNVGSYYAELKVSHQMTDYLSHRIDLQRNVSLGLNQGSEYIEQFTGSYFVEWALTPWMNLSANATYEHGKQTFQNMVTVAPGVGFLVNQTEVYDRIGAGPLLAWQATEKLSTSLGYNFYLRKSNLPGRGYTANEVSLKLNYAF